MSWFKKAKDKLKIGVGAVLLATLGATGLFWGKAKLDYAHNVLDFRGTVMGTTVFVGDTGQKGKQLDAVVASMRKLCPKTVVILGDLQYPSGPNNAEDFAEYLTKPFNKLCAEHQFTFIVSGNHHAYSAKKGRDWLAENIFERKAIGQIYMSNFFYGVVFEDACLLGLETTFYDVKLGDPKIQKEQEKFAAKFLADDKCAGKRKVAFGHHPLLSSGAHGDAVDRDMRGFFASVIIGKADFYIAGHDHNLSFEGCYSSLGDVWMQTSHLLSDFTARGNYIEKLSGVSTCHFVSGAGSKLRECIRQNRHCVSAPGYWVYENGSMRTEVVK